MKESLNTSATVSNETFSSLFETMDQGVVYQDAAGVIIKANPAAERILGLTREQIMGRSSLDPRWKCIREDGSDISGDEHPSMIALRTGRPVIKKVMGMYLPDTDELRWIIVSSVPDLFRDGVPQQIITTFTDITDLKNTEERLQQSEKRFHNLFDTMHEGFAFHEVICNAAGEVTDYRYLDLNQAFEQLTGLKRETTVGRTVREVLPEIEEEWIQCFGRVALTGIPDERESHVRELDRYYRARAYSPEKGKFAVVFEETTEQKRVEAALRESRDLFALFMKYSPIYTFIKEIDGDRSRVLEVSDNFNDMVGIPVSEMRGRSMEEIFPPDFARKITEDDLAVIARGDVLTIEESFNGIEYITIKFPILRKGKASLLAGFTIDITDRKRAEEERIALEKQLLHAQKLESLGVLAGGIAHDFNNILTAIIGNADLALMRLNKESPVLENLRKIEQATARAADLARQMLAYSGKGKFVVEAIDLNRLIEEMFHMLEVSISKKAVLKLNPYHPLPSVEADATQIRQIIMNLVINASEAIGDRSGIIAVTTGVMGCDRNYLKEVWLDSNISEGLYVYLEIADTGCGMDKETLAKLFDPFFTTKFTGRGLGMAAVLGIVRGHKGAIKVYSELNSGTTFKVLLPASERPVELFNGTDHSDHWQGSGTVLLVDDEETVRGIGGEMLEVLGFEVLTANDGREALETYRNNPGIAMVILDLTMPHMDGEQCFRELRQLDPKVKVIMSSGFSEQEVTHKFAGKGLAGFIQKPYKLNMLKEVIRRV